MRLVVSSTDQAYALPAEAAVYSVGAGRRRLDASATSPCRRWTGGREADAGSSRWWVLLAVVVGLGLLGWAAA